MRSYSARYLSQLALKSVYCMLWAICTSCRSALPRAHGLLLALLLLLPQHLELLVRAVRLEVVALLLALAPVLLEDAQEFQDLGVGLLAGLVRLARFDELEELCEVDGRRLGHVEALDELARGLLLEADLL